MNNIIVVDIYASLFGSILANSDNNISLAVVDNEIMIAKCRSTFGDRIKNYYHRFPSTNTEFYKIHSTDYDLSYEEIEQYRATQLKVERFLHRELNDEASIQERYLTALRYFLGFFDKNKIDFVIAAHVEHGAIWDSLIFDIAKAKNIPVYIISAVSSNGSEEINCVVRANDNKILSLEAVESREQIDFNLFFQNLEKYFMSYKKHKKTFTIPFNFNLLRKLKYILISLRKIFNIHNKLKPKQYDKYYTQLTVDNTEALESKLHINNLYKLYRKFAVKPDYKEKYILYPLHQDPEASTMIRATISCQLFIIKQLSNILPKGWKLYVREHPSQFYSYKSATYFFKNISYYRAIDFYARVKNMENVKLIDLNTPMYELEKHCQAINTITGTAAIEGILMNKPIILWGNGNHFAEFLKDSFNIKRLNDLITAVKKIKNGFIPRYDDLHTILSKYTFKMPAYGYVKLGKENDLYKEIITKVCLENKHVKK